MPHVSSKLLSSKKLAELDKRLFDAFASTNIRTRKQLYSELLTATERVMLAKRLEMMLLISKGISTHTISRVLCVSPSTVARFEQAVSNGKFRQTESWLKRQKFSSQILQLLFELAAVPFEVERRRRTLQRHRAP